MMICFVFPHQAVESAFFENKNERTIHIPWKEKQLLSSLFNSQAMFIPCALFTDFDDGLGVDWNANWTNQFEIVRMTELFQCSFLFFSSTSF